MIVRSFAPGATVNNLRFLTSPFLPLLARFAPEWSGRSPEEQNGWVDWYERTAHAIARQHARSFRDPSHDASDIVQDILLKLLTKFGEEGSPRRLLLERPCVRNLMKWKAWDRLDWESAARRDAHRRAPLPEEEIGLPSRGTSTPDRYAQIADSERVFRREIRDPDHRTAYLLFRMGKSPKEVAQMCGILVRDAKAMQERLANDLRDKLVG